MRITKYALLLFLSAKLVLAQVIPGVGASGVSAGSVAPGGGGGGSGTVTSIPDGSTNGVTWTVATRTTVPTFTFSLGAITPTSIAMGADPADAGEIRLPNAGIIAWEASPAGTDVTQTVNSSEQFVFSNDILSPSLATSLVTSSTTFALLNTTATTVNFAGGASTALNIGNASGATSMLGIIGFDGATPSSSTAAILPAATTSLSSLRVPHGSAPTSPVNGDLWTTTTGMFVRVNGSTVGPLAAAGGITVADTQVLFADGANTPAGDAGMTYNKTTDVLTTVGGFVSNGAGTGIWTITGSASGSFNLTTANATAQSVTISPLAQTSGATVLSITDQAGVNRNILTGSLTATRVPFASSAGILTDDADLTFATDTLTATKLIGSTSITNSALTSGRVVFSGTAGIQSDDADLTFATDTLTATRISTGNVQVTVTATGSVTGSNAVSFSGVGFLDWTMTGNVTFTTSNLAAGKSVTLRLLASGGTRTLTFPGTWIFVGAAAPASLASGKYAVLTLTSFGTTDADVVAAYSAQP
jgi:hypothetical protein